MSLFPKDETPESKLIREQSYQQVLKMVAVKREIWDRELWDADVKIDDDKVVNQVDLGNDAFFASDSDDVIVEKRPVMRDGRVPKLAKNFEKIQKEKIEK